MTANGPSFRRVVRANRLIAEGKCLSCEMDYKPKLAKLEAERADLWRKNRELLGAHDVKAAALGDAQDDLRDTKSLHREIIDLIDRTQSCTLGLSHSECLAEIKRRLEK